MLIPKFHMHKSPLWILYKTFHTLYSHDMTQMMQRGNLAMGFDQTKIAHGFSTTKDGGQIKITALNKKDNNTIRQIKSHTKDIQNDLEKETL